MRNYWNHNFQDKSSKDGADKPKSEAKLNFIKTLFTNTTKMKYLQFTLNQTTEAALFNLKVFHCRSFPGLINDNVDFLWSNIERYMVNLNMNRTS